MKHGPTLSSLQGINHRFRSHWWIALLLACPVYADASSSNAGYRDNTPGSLLALSLEDLMTLNVSSSSFFNLDQTRSPGYLTIIDHKALDRSGERTLTDVINAFVPGSQSSKRFFGALIGQRGISIDVNSKTAVLLDGSNLNQRTHIGYMLPLLLPLLGDLDRIEVFNGPSGLVHGTGAISGYINLIPKRGKDHAGWRTKTEWGMIDDLLATEISYGKSSSRADWFAYLGFVSSEGYRPSQKGELALLKSENQSSPHQRKFPDGLPPRYDHFAAFNPASWKASFNWTAGNFSVYTEFLDMYLNMDDLIDGYNASRGVMWNLHENAQPVFIDAFDRDYPVTRTHAHFLLRPKYVWELSATESIEWMGSLYVVDSGSYDVEKGYKEIHPVENPLRAHNVPSEIEYSLKCIYRKSIRDSLAFAGGVALSKREFYDQKSFFKSEGTGVELRETGREQTLMHGGIFSWLEYSLFSEWIYSPNEKTTVLVGGRLDGVRYEDDQFRSSGKIRIDTHRSFSPRISLAYAFDDGQFLKLSYQNGFRNPDMANLEKAVAGGEVRPETMHSVELNYSQKWGDRCQWDVNAYYNHLQDTIGWNSGFDNGFANMPEAFGVAGTEWIFKCKTQKQSEFAFIYGYARPVGFPSEIAFQSDFRGVIPVNAQRSVFSNFPAHQIKTWYSHSFLDNRLLLNVALTYWYQRDDISYRSAHPAYKQDRTEVDITVRYQVTEQFAVKIIAQNLTEDSNALPHYSSGHAEPPVGWADRLIYLQAVWRF